MSFPTEGETASNVANLTSEAACEALRGAGVTCFPRDAQIIARDERLGAHLLGRNGGQLLFCEFVRGKNAMACLAVEAMQFEVLVTSPNSPCSPRPGIHASRSYLR